jgi:two-component system cell cycle sensor histidine kinase/response regulator CckA
MGRTPKKQIIETSTRPAPEELYRAIFEQAADGIFIADTQGRFLEVNRQGCELLGYSRQEVLNLSWQDLIPTEDLANDPLRQDDLCAGKTVLKEQRLRCRDGRLLPVEISARMLSDGSLLGIVRDISGRMRAEHALREKDELLREMSGMAKIGGWEFDVATLQGTWTEEVARIHGLDPEIETNVELGLSFYQGESREKIESALREAIDLGKPYDLELEIVTAEGNHKWVRTIGHPIKQNNQVVKVRGTFQDITERKQAEEAMRLSMERLRLALDAAKSGTWEWDLRTNENVWSEELWKVYGLEPYSCVPSYEAWRQVVHPDDRSMAEQVVQEAARQGAELNFEFRVLDRDGTERWLMSRGRPLRDANGQVVRFIGIVLDITERKQAEEDRAKLEEQLRQAQKMESVGRLAGGVAHDFNNLLTVIQGHCDLMQIQMSDRDPLLKEVKHIQQAGERAASLTRQLLAFSRRQMLAPIVLDLNDLLANLRRMLERLIGEDITLTTVLAPGLWSVTADPGQIEQVIMNLAINARDAMPTGGKLTIETGNVHLDDSYARTHPEALVGPCVMLAVSDTGHGMDEPTRSRIFEPFFTTKEPGRGTGLELATVYGIVKQSEGDILVYSKPGHGTTFKIYLPASETGAISLHTSHTQPVTRGGNETILLVEDEEMVRDLVRIVLQNAGYSVLEAPHGKAALSLSAQHQGPIDLLMTDVVMPEIGGRELAEQLKALRPQMKVLFMSGYTDDVVVRYGLLTAEVEFLPKPFSPSVLASKVREVLGK